MKAAGATYGNAFVVDSLCCPSRASIFTGQAAAPDRRADQHAERLREADRRLRGVRPQYGNLAKSFNVALQNSGYTTGFIGKYMNRYEADRR